ncbi:hypothetical protein ACIGXA_32870 [Streptomyces fildesensis]|uniref:Stealth protein CR2 conserved region 2 domain-containing protein n=1 Tax=Streptomyces fildesensis TaxID=375757 RepID=A0ABW8CIX7_9ACTN
MADDSTHVVGNTYRALVPERVRQRVSTQVSREARARVKRHMGTVVAPADRLSVLRVQRRLQRSALSRAAASRPLPGGRLAQVHAGLTPGEVFRRNLEAVTSALEANGVSYFAVPAVDDRHASLAVPANQRLRVYRALVALFREAPGTVQQVLPTSRRARPQYGADVRFSRLDSAKVLRVSWLRSDPTGRLVIGSSIGVEIEFWSRDGDFLMGPRPNRVMRKLPADAPEVLAGLRHFTQYGNGQDTQPQVRTRAYYTATRADEIDFPIDAVCLWSPGDDEALLRATLRSLHQHAPWIRRVHLVTGAVRPSWLAEHSKLRVVAPAELVTEAGEASDDVRSRVHLVPDLAEHFVLFPAGSMLGQRAKPHLFFTPFGHARFLRTPPDPREPSGAAWRLAIEEKSGRAVADGIRPGPQPRLRSVTAEIAGLLPAGEPRTPAQLAGLDADPLDCLHHYWAYAQGTALPGEARTIALHAAAPGLDTRLVRLLARRDTVLLHFSGLSDPVTSADAADRVRELLDTLFPVTSPFETSQATSATSGGAR